MYIITLIYLYIPCCRSSGLAHLHLTGQLARFRQNNWPTYRITDYNLPISHINYDARAEAGTIIASF